ncbi:MAG TPA: hypothetical protein VKL19_11145 [Thermoanaerobaculia bacterium]|nr:hypothetical protein [Thermoanaerobaculia bacterium]
MVFQKIANEHGGVYPKRERRLRIGRPAKSLPGRDGSKAELSRESIFLLHDWSRDRAIW